MTNRNSKHIRRTTWLITGLQIGAVLFGGGLTLLYLNPFWRFDESGLLNWRVHWWNAAAEIMIACGVLIAALALLGCVALIVSRLSGRRTWPYLAAALLVVCVVVWVVPEGFTRDLNAHFEWNSAEGFDVFLLQSWDQAAGTWQPVKGEALRTLIAIQTEPVLRGYFRLNDWRKMNGNIAVRVARIIPIAWPVALGNGGETLEDPDETALMRAAAQGDLKSVREILSNATDGNVNALDQDGQSALILACQSPKPNADVVRALIAAGADVNLRARNGYTALTWALAHDNNELSRLLRRAGGRP